MDIAMFEGNDAGYRAWLTIHPDGYVLNTRRGIDPAYMVLHRAGCHSISQYAANAPEGAFTERNYIKVCASDLDEMRNWVRSNGRPDGSFSKECGFCRPRRGPSRG